MASSSGARRPRWVGLAALPKTRERSSRRHARALSAAALLLSLLTSALAMPAASPAGATVSERSFAPFQAHAAGHDWANAYLLALLSHYMYPSNLDATVDPSAGPTTEDNFEGRFRALVERLGLTFVDYIRNPITDTEAAVVATDQAVIVAFRGTETDFSDLSNAIDILVDLALNPTAGIHSGFLAAATSTMGDVEAAIATQPGKQVWFTGHSLGGALATLTAAMLQARQDPIHVQGVSTYGAPRVFMEATPNNADVAAAYNNLFSDRPTQRWVNNLDPIPHVPPSIPFILPYKHIGQVNNIGVDGDACTATLADAERTLEVDGAAIAALVSQAGIAIANEDHTAAFAAMAGIVDEFLSAADMADHDIARYSARIFAHLPAELQALVPIPPYPADPQTSCDIGDTTPPVVTPTVTGTLGNNGWYRSDVTVSWTVTDDESAMSSSGCDTTVVQNDTPGLTLTCSATSAGGTTQVPVTIKRDATAPTVVVLSPVAGADYFRNQVVVSDYSCSDGVSGIAVCGGPVADGASIDTSGFGAHIFTVSAQDAAGNVASLTHNYTVTYEFSGFAQPVANPPAVNDVRAGSKVPFKWTLTGATGQVVADRTDLFRVGWTAAFPCGSSASPEIESTSSAGQSGLRWDGEAQQYSFVAASDRSDADGCRYFVVRVGPEATAVSLVRFV